MTEAKTTLDHDKIRRWVEARGGRPARVKGTGSARDAGLLRIDFGDPDEGLEAISWDAFFAQFETSELRFLYQDKTEDGAESRFNKLISRSDHE